MKSLIFYLLLFTPFLSRGGVDVTNGAGYSEQNVVYAHANIRSLVSICLKTSSCGLTAVEGKSLEFLVAKIASMKLSFSNDSVLKNRLYAIERDRWVVNANLLWTDSQKTKSFEMKDAVHLMLTMANEGSGLYSTPLRDKIQAHLSVVVRETSISLATGVKMHFILLGERSRALLGIENERAMTPFLDLTREIAKEVSVCDGAIQILDPVLQMTAIEPEGFRVRFLVKAKNACAPSWLSLSISVAFDKRRWQLRLLELNRVDEGIN